MGNYKDFEQDFVMRTMMLIDQYNEEIIPKKPFQEQFNYTLLLNCLLGLIVMPKEKALTAIPTDRLTKKYKQSMGLENSTLPGAETSLRQLIIKMRHSVAHFDFEVVSTNENMLFDIVKFKDTESKDVFASFKANEIYPFLQFYTDCLHRNIPNIQGSTT